VSSTLKAQRLRASVVSIVAIASYVVFVSAMGSLNGAARAELKDAKGQLVGTATLSETPNGVLLHLNLSNAPAGAHAFHIHTTGRCDPPDFESAGAHFNPKKAMHGFLEVKGPHAGDLPNLHIPQGGKLTVEFLAEHASLTGKLNPLLDADGATLVLHASPDDYRTDPAGNAGDRVACGVIAR
jgi:Cu-Zn family superoxide dismutase